MIYIEHGMTKTQRNLLIIFVIIILGLVVFIFSLLDNSKPPAPVTVKTRVMNVNLHGWTRVALQDDGTNTPYTIQICGEHAELWQGEHVIITMQPPGDSDMEKQCYTLLHIERLD